MDPCVGIDLGTTHSCVAIYKNGRPEIIPNDQGNRVTPSYVAFADGTMLVGEAAKVQVAGNSSGTVYNAKRLIGRNFFDKEVQKDIQSFLYNVEGKDDGKINILLSNKDSEVQLCPEEVSAMVLKKMKDTAEAYIGKEVKSAVITVPAYFNHTQRIATMDAGRIAGFTELRLLNEPTAAGMAYGFDEKVGVGDADTQNILIYDLGGGTFDVSIIKVSKGEFVVMASAGKSDLGGEDFTNRLVLHFVSIFKDKNGIDISKNAKAMHRLKTECETAKKLLSGRSKADIHVDALHDGIDFDGTINRAKFEELCSDLLKDTIGIVARTLKDTNISKGDLSDIVLVGGSTRIPMVQKLVSEYFDGKELCRSINPDEAVACGAAVQASLLTNDGAVKGMDIIVRDVTPLTLGVRVHGGLMSTLIKRNKPIPTQTEKCFSTCDDYQEKVEIKVYEGERAHTKNNHLLGAFILCGIEKGPRGAPEIVVTFSIDNNGILEVTGKDSKSGRFESIQITTKDGRLSKDEIEKMIQDAEKFRDEDQAIVNGK